MLIYDVGLLVLIVFYLANQCFLGIGCLILSWVLVFIPSPLSLFFIPSWLPLARNITLPFCLLSLVNVLYVTVKVNFLKCTYGHATLLIKVLRLFYYLENKNQTLESENFKIPQYFSLWYFCVYQVIFIFWHYPCLYSNAPCGKYMIQINFWKTFSQNYSLEP